MPDPSYVIETGGREQGLAFHLDTAFYPPLPKFVKDAFLEAFRGYWSYDYDITELQERLLEDAGYKGDLGSYNFWQFLNEEDLL